MVLSGVGVMTSWSRPVDLMGVTGWMEAGGGAGAAGCRWTGAGRLTGFS